MTTELQRAQAESRASDMLATAVNDAIDDFMQATGLKLRNAHVFILVDPDQYEMRIGDAIHNKVQITYRTLK